MTVEASFSAPGHAVRNFVAAVLAVGAVATAAWWFGFAYPRMDVSLNVTTFDEATGAASATFDVRNEARLAVEIVGVRDHDPDVDVVTAPTGVHLDANATATVTIGWRVVDCSGARDGWDTTLRVRVKSGLTRDVHVRVPEFFAELACPQS